jgi:hypothetical protein
MEGFQMSHLLVLAFITVLAFGTQPIQYSFRKVTSRKTASR